MNNPIEILTKELISMGFPEEMAKRMAVETCKKTMERSKSMENNLPAFFIDENNNIVLIDTSLGLK